MNKVFEGFDVVDPEILCATIRFYPNQHLPLITIRAYFNPHAGKYFGEQSHYIKTPRNAAEYRSSRCFGDSVEEALHYTVRSIMLDYGMAVHNGEQPDESWFVTNERWK